LTIVNGLYRLVIMSIVTVKYNCQVSIRLAEKGGSIHSSQWLMSIQFFSKKNFFLKEKVQSSSTLYFRVNWNRIYLVISSLQW